MNLQDVKPGDYVMVVGKDLPHEGDTGKVIYVSTSHIEVMVDFSAFDTDYCFHPDDLCSYYEIEEYP